MKRIILVVVLALGISTGMRAQVTIGSVSAPDGSAVLDLNTGGENNKGLLLPLVQLTSATDQITVPSPATGLMVYANGGGLSTGVYVWNGTKWVSVGDAPSDLVLRPKSLSFGTTEFGAPAPAALTVIAANFGDGETGELTLGGDMATYYTLPPADETNIPALSIGEFTVQPNGSLPVGLYSGSITVGNAAIEPQTIDVSYEVTKNTQTINGLTEITLTYEGTDYTIDGVSATSGLPVEFSSGDATIAQVDGNKVSPVYPGETTLRAYQDGNDTFAATEVSVKVTVNKKANVITWADLPTGVKTTTAPFPLTATATSGEEVSFASSVSSVVTISGNVVTINGDGTTVITASSPETDKFLAAPDLTQTLVVPPPCAGAQVDGVCFVIGTPVRAAQRPTSCPTGYSPVDASTCDGRAWYGAYGDTYVWYFINPALSYYGYPSSQGTWGYWSASGSATLPTVCRQN